MITICPYCDYEATEHETLEGETNKRDGDISICINCGEVSLFQHTYFGGLKKVDINSLEEDTKQEVLKIQEAWLQTKSLKSTDKIGGKEC